MKSKPKMRTAILCGAAVTAAALTFALPTIVRGPKIVTTGGDLVAANPDGVETVGDVDIDGDAQVILATDADSKVVLSPGFEASPGAGGTVWIGTLDTSQTYGGNTLQQLAALASEPDADGDGVPDWWESLYGLGSGDYGDAGHDRDGDGASNWDEYRLGRDPTVAESIPEWLADLHDDEADPPRASPTYDWNANPSSWETTNSSSTSTKLFLLQPSR